MLTTLAESSGLPGGLDFEFAVASEGRLASELRERGGRVHALGDVRLSHPASILRARRHLRAVLGEQQHAAVVCHAPWSHAIFGGVVRSVGLPSVLWQHDRATGAPLVERACRAAGADLVICNSHWTADSAASWLPNVPRCVIYCPVESKPATEGDREEIRGILGATSADVVILSASRLEPWKGHLDLIRALARLGTRSWTLWVAGGAQRSHERDHAVAIDAEVRRLGLGARVKFLGERRDVRRLLAGADLLAQANVEPEPFGIVFAEALFAGVPVVTTNMGGAPEIIDNTCGRLVAPRDLEALAAALDELVSNVSLRASLGAAGPAHAGARCDASVALPRLEAALLSIRAPTAA